MSERQGQTGGPMSPEQYAAKCAEEGREILAEDIVGGGGPRNWAENEIQREGVEIAGDIDARQAPGRWRVREHTLEMVV